MRGLDNVPPETTICFLALKVRDCCCLGEFELATSTLVVKDYLLMDGVASSAQF